MKKLLVVLMAVAISVQLIAQNKPAQKSGGTKPAAAKQTPAQEPAKEADPGPNPIAEHAFKKYSIATRWNDLDVAKDALYDLIAEYPGSDSLLFSLAYYYFENQRYPSAVLICQDLIQRNPSNIQAIEVAAESFQALNIPDKALQNFETLYLKTQNVATLYKMVFLQFQTKKFAECLTNADILLAKPEANTAKVIFNDADNKEKEYIMKVAILNLKGMVYREQSDKVNAKKFFDEALAVAPDFQPAKKNLSELK